MAWTELNFKLIDPVPDGMDIVCVYRPRKIFVDSQSQSVYVNDRKIALLSSPAYTFYMTPPGIVNVKILGLREAYVRFEVEAVKSYFLKSSISKVFTRSRQTIEQLVSRIAHPERNQPSNTIRRSA